MFLDNYFHLRQINDNEDGGLFGARKPTCIDNYDSFFLNDDLF